jgi:hypothetical protein
MTAAVPPAPDEACLEFRRALAEAERLAEAGAAPSLGPVRAHAASCASCARRASSRVARVEGFAALRSRSLPPGILDGLYERVRERAPLVPIGGGMSPAFLAAPESLRAWRRTAMAAGVLVLAGATLVFTGRAGMIPSSGERPLVDARETLLEPFDEPSAAEGRAFSPAIRPVGYGSFFRGQRLPALGPAVPAAPAPKPPADDKPKSYD